MFTVRHETTHRNICRENPSICNLSMCLYVNSWVGDVTILGGFRKNALRHEYRKAAKAIASLQKADRKMRILRASSSPTLGRYTSVCSKPYRFYRAKIARLDFPHVTLVRASKLNSSTSAIDRVLDLVRY